MDVPAEFLRRLAGAAEAQTLPRFRAAGAIANKIEGGFDPVTEADREAELALRRLIRAEYPGHGVLGEEFGPENADSRHVWVVDPIDGTRSFISGIPLWGTLVGLTEDGRAVAGMMAQPFTRELFLASGGEAWWERADERRRLVTSGKRALAEATLCTTTPEMFKGERRAAYDRVEKAVRLVRYGTDCYAYAMVAAGQVDLVVETGLQAYDIIALIPIIEAAGGIVTDWSGGRAERGGDIVAAASAELHAQALAALGPAAIG